MKRFIVSLVTMYAGLLLIVLILMQVGGCSSTGPTHHVWTAQECRQAGGILMCEGNWGRCECVEAERARQAIESLP